MLYDDVEQWKIVCMMMKTLNDENKMLYNEESTDVISIMAFRNTVYDDEPLISWRMMNGHVVRRRTMWILATYNARVSVRTTWKLVWCDASSFAADDEEVYVRRGKKATHDEKTMYVWRYYTPRRTSESHFGYVEEWCGTMKICMYDICESKLPLILRK